MLEQQARKVLAYINQKSGQQLRPSNPYHLSFICDRLSEGYSVDLCKKVVDYKHAQFKNRQRLIRVTPRMMFAKPLFEKILKQLGYECEKK